MRPWPLFLLSLLGCRIEPETLPLPPRSPSTGSATTSTAPPLEISPPPHQGTIASVVHLHLPLPKETLVAPASVVLVKGELSDTALRGLREGVLPSSAQSRAVAASIRSTPGSLRIFPRDPLQPGHAYTLAVGPLLLRVPLIVEDEGPPILERVWPPGEATEDRQAIFCGEKPLPNNLIQEGLGPPFLLEQGAPTRPDLVNCVTLTAPAESRSEPFPTALLQEGERVALLAPAPVLRGDLPSAVALACKDDELIFGPGCLQVEDDRARWRLPPEPWLLLSGEGTPKSASGSLLLRGLPPESTVTLEARVLDLRGKIHEARGEVTTRAPIPHVVLSEVLADALGPEPASEWVELYNDGALPVLLEGWALEDGQGLTPLPPFEIAPGSYALLANEMLETSGDHPVAPGCPILHLPKLGKSGLSNQGEVLTLLDAQGTARSRLPATPRPKPGLSLQRLHMDFPMEDGGHFTLGKPTPCRSNLP
ncbi:MAG: lamin tail domain-containing protein [Myxococcales bacterium]|nr:lamin tail domain-containing protein [Polyangiaceae bacterium]MDW8250663.1 lamin tail domain-containing protein [Myxococcales bacterium]